VDGPKTVFRCINYLLYSGLAAPLPQRQTTIFHGRVTPLGQLIIKVRTSDIDRGSENDSGFAKLIIPL